MIVAQDCYHEMINSIARELKARVELLDGDSIIDTFYYDGALQSFSVERIGDSTKFFGYGICQKLTVKLRDNDRAINIVKGQGLEVVVGVGCEYLYTCPIFFVDDVKRNENTNELEIVAYDAIYRAKAHTVSEVVMPTSYTIEEFTHACAAVLGMPINIDESAKEAFSRLYDNGANFDGTESIRDALDDIAEATGTIYYMCRNWCITFKRLDINGDPVLHFDKSKYFTLSAKTAHTLQNIVHTTELGDNVEANSGINGATQYLRDNAFIELRDDVGDIVNEILGYVSGLTISPIEAKHRGNFLLECGDKVSFENKDGSIVECFIVDDTFTYNGGLTGNTKWHYETNESETTTNSSNLGTALKQTFARVDKQGHKIDLVASETSENAEAISSLQIGTDEINASISELTTNVNTSIDGVNQEITSVRNEVEAKMSSEDVTFAIRSELANGVSSVQTETGYRFDSDGLMITKTGSEMSTQITDDGMQVFRDSTAVLTANNVGVDAVNLHATTYLIIGTNSRFENYGSDRTGCFWIGG